VVAGTQTPVQASFTQAFVQGVAAPHSPWSLQVCTVVPDAQRVSAGRQSPPHALPTQAFSQSAASDQTPDAAQLRKRTFERHSVASGMHSRAGAAGVLGGSSEDGSDVGGGSESVGASGLCGLAGDPLASGSSSARVVSAGNSRSSMEQARTH
jgi:hypothetical protein